MHFVPNLNCVLGWLCLSVYFSQALNLPAEITGHLLCSDAPLTFYLCKPKYTVVCCMNQKEVLSHS